MTVEEKEDRTSGAAELARQAEAAEAGLISELLAFVRHEKRWFLVPILIVLLFAGVFVVLSGTSVAPFIYALF